jgi:hypothetical protein
MGKLVPSIPDLVRGFGSDSGSGSIGNCLVRIRPGFRIRIRINLSCWIRIRIQEGKNDPLK